MNTTEIRMDLEEIRALLEWNQAKRAIDKLDRALQHLDLQKQSVQASNGHGAPLLTFIQQCQKDEDAPYLDAEDATRWLGIPSEADLRNLIRNQGIKHKSDGDLIAIPLSELERIDNSSTVQQLREAKRANNKAKILAMCNGYLPSEGEDELYLSTVQAAQWLGIGIDSVLRAAARRQELKHKRDENRILIPLSELQRIENTSMIQGLRASTLAWEKIRVLEDPPEDDFMTQKEIDDLRVPCSKR